MFGRGPCAHSARVLLFAICLLPPAWPAPPRPVGTNFEIATDAPDGLGGRPAISFDGTNFFVVWLGEQGTVRGSRITPDGAVLDPGGVSIGGGDGRPSVAFDGTEYLVIWVDEAEVYGAKVGVDGSLVSGPFAITAGGAPKVRDISLAFDGTHYLVAWRAGSWDTIRAARVATDGTIVDAPAGFSLGNGFFPWVAFDGTNHLVVWSYHHDSSWTSDDVFGNRVAPDGSVLDGSGFAICCEDGDQSQPSVAYGDDVLLVVWLDSRGGVGDGSFDDFDARGMRLATDGSALDPSEILLAEPVGSQAPVNAVFDGTDFFILWHTDLWPADFRLTDVYGRRVSSGGAVLDQQGIPASTAFGHQFGPRIGFGGGRFLVAWNDGFRCDDCIWGQILDKGQAAPAASHPGSDDAATDEIDEPAVESAPWSPEPSPTDQALQAIDAVDRDDAYAVGDTPGLFHWDGTGWSTIPYPAPTGGYGVSVGAPDEVWITGWCYHVAWFDGEAIHNPSCLDWPTSELGHAIERLPSGALLTVGAPSTSRYYEGPIQSWGGPDWQDLALPHPVDLHDLWQAPDGTVYAVGDFGTVLEWNGSGWDAMEDVPTVQSLNAVWGRDDGSLCAVGDFGEILFFDGVEWTRQDSGTLEHLFDVEGVGDTEIVAVGASGTILGFDGTSWSPEASGTDRMLLGVARAGDRLLAVGDDGVVLSRAAAPYDAEADLAVTKGDGLDEAVPGERVVYEVTVTNQAARADRTTASVTDLPPPALDCTWTCEPLGEATCAHGPWTGALDDWIELRGGATAVFTADCSIDAAATGSITNTVEASLPASILELDESDDLAADTDRLLPLGECGKPDHRVLSAEVIDSPRSVEACLSVTLGPDLVIAPSCILTVRAGQRVVLVDGTEVQAGGGLAVEIDPSMAP